MSAISSLTMDLPLVTVFAPRSRRISSTISPRLSGIARPVHLAAARDDAALERLQQGVEMGQRIVADRAALLAQCFPVADSASTATCAAEREMRLQPAKRDAQIRIVQRALSGFAKALRIERHGSPNAGSSAMPASTSATWRTRMLDALALHAPFEVQQAAEIAAQHQLRAGRIAHRRSCRRPCARRFPGT